METKKLIFKKEIINLIGNEKWIMPDTAPAWNKFVETSIKHPYLENPRNRKNPNLVLDDKYYRSKYYNFNVNFHYDLSEETDVTNNESKYNYYDYWAKGIAFNSGDNDN
ncbi:hypothetical protein [Mycoplasmopsis californica]|uniref:hypothetical protein n=1 Tax=Mycoplasmopsis californica TaxID=2113 RepID=UPI000597B009|nr:hypothetical protein [Mycoplasmopsis californica]